MFYGRPAYRAVQQDESNGIDAYWPVCFVLDPARLAPDRFFPFDSGAFQQGRYADFMYHGMIKEDFELARDPTTPQRLLAKYWRDERAYFDADTQAGLSRSTVDPFDFEAKAYASLIAGTGRAPFDERNSTVEAQFGEPLMLEGNTIAVVFPSEFARPNVLADIERLGAVALPFSVVRRHGAENMVSDIYGVVRDLLSGKHGRIRCW